MARRRRLTDDEIWQRYKDGLCDRGGFPIDTEEQLARDREDPPCMAEQEKAAKAAGERMRGAEQDRSIKSEVF